MARFGGMNALRAALGAVTGVAEGLQQRDLLAAQKKKEEEAAQFAQFNALRAAGFGFSPVRTAADPAAREAFALEAPELPAPTLGGSQMGQALAKATQGGLGVSSRPTGMLDSPISLALDTSKTRQFERGAGMQAANPAERVKLGGVELGITAPETEEQKSQRQLDLYRSQRTIDAEMADKKARDAAAAGESAFNTTVQRLMRGGMDEKDAIMAATLEAKYGDVAMTPSVKAQLRGQDITKRGQDLSYAATVRGQDMTDSRTREKSDANEMITGLQAMGVARANSALNLLNTNHELMKQFEKSVLDGKSQVSALQLEAARKAMKGDEGAAVAEKALKDGIPMLMEPNPALLRYIRAAKGISGAVREITPRGGSNLMMQMEQALAGIGPAGTDQQSIDQVQAFRNDILTGVQEGVRALRGARSVEGGAPAQSGGLTYTPGMSFDEWKRRKTGGQ